MLKSMRQMGTALASTRQTGTAPFSQSRKSGSPLKPAFGRGCLVRASARAADG